MSALDALGSASRPQHLSPSGFLCGMAFERWLDLSALTQLCTPSRSCNRWTDRKQFATWANNASANGFRRWRPRARSYVHGCARVFAFKHSSHVIEGASFSRFGSETNGMFVAVDVISKRKLLFQWFERLPLIGKHWKLHFSSLHQRVSCLGCQLRTHWDE